MNTYLNYLIESNISLAIFLGIYTLLFRRETDFSVKRLILLGGIFVSVGLPLLHFENATTAVFPAIGEVMTTVWLPEIIIGNSAQTTASSPLPSVFQGLAIIYAVGVLFFLFIFIVQLWKLTQQIRSSRNRIRDRYIIAEVASDTPSYSFFNFICIGNAAELSNSEKNQIIAHECVHVRQLHSFDILLINILKIFFWFNPLIRIYKNILVELHEFEADARSVENHAINDYCNLLAKVALMSADLRLANYFTNSLTLKRIAMIRKIKMKIGGWKLAVTGLVLPLLFFIVSCQDQVIGEATELAKSSTVALDVPADVQAQYDQMKAAKPEMNLLLLEVDDSGKARLEEMEKKMNSIDQSKITSMNVIKTKASGTTPARNFIIVQYNENVAMVSEKSQVGDVFVIVEETASPVGGMDDLYQFVGSHLVYPEDASKAGITGQVFVEFIVEKDGTITNPQVLKGVHELLDKAALDVVSQFPKWIPAKNKGEIVRQKMVLPVTFKLG
jgi:TonB family protein